MTNNKATLCALHVMAKYKCPHCYLEVEYDRLDGLRDGDSMDEYCRKCDKPITIYVEVAVKLEAEQRSAENE